MRGVGRPWAGVYRGKGGVDLWRLGWVKLGVRSQDEELRG